MRWLLFCILCVLVPRSAAAQDCPDGTPEGMNPPGNPCQLCRNGDFESLPPRTVCSDERRFSCDANGAYRTECVLENPADPDGPTRCEMGVFKGASCPSGLACDEMFCRTFCDADADCQPGYECVVDRCVLPEPPEMGMPDMSTPDMSMTDMSERRDTGPADDMFTRPDTNVGDGSMTPPLRERVDSGCCRVVPARSGASPLVLALLALMLFWRRRA